MSAVKKTSFKITGMSCAACANRVEKALSSLPGVQSARVNFALENAVVEYRPGEVSINEIHKRVEETGYGILLGKAEMKLEGMSCAACAARIEKTLNSLPGVIKAGVNFATEKAVVNYDESRISLAEIKAKPLLGAGLQYTWHSHSGRGTAESGYRRSGHGLQLCFRRNRCPQA